MNDNFWLHFHELNVPSIYTAVSISHLKMFQEKVIFLWFLLIIFGSSYKEIKRHKLLTYESSIWMDLRGMINKNVMPPVSSVPIVLLFDFSSSWN